MGWTTKNRQLANDLRQDALLRIVKKWDQITSAADPKAYGYKVAPNAVKDALKVERDRPERPRPASEDDDDVYASVDSFGPEEMRLFGKRALRPCRRPDCGRTSDDHSSKYLPAMK